MNRALNCVLFVLALGAIVVLAQPAAATVITNGDFEATTNQAMRDTKSLQKTNGPIVPHNGVPGWDLCVSDGDLHDAGILGKDAAATGGDVSAWQGAGVHDNYAVVLQSGGWLSQDLTFDSPGTATISFYAEGLVEAAHPSDPLVVTLGGTALSFSGSTTVTPPKAASNGTTMTLYTSAPFALGAAGSAALKFTAQGSTVWYATTLDDVSIAFTAAPEPSTMVLVVTGLIGLLCYAWRKRR